MILVNKPGVTKQRLLTPLIPLDPFDSPAYAGWFVTNDVDPNGLSRKSPGTGPYLPPTVVRPPKGFKKGEVCVVVCVDQSAPGDRNCSDAGMFSYGHAFVTVIAYDREDKLKYITRGFYPDYAYQSTNRQPQGGHLCNDHNHRYDVEYTYVATGSGNPTFDDMLDFIISYPQNNQYDLDDCNCANFTLDVLRKAGHPKFNAHFGQVSSKLDGKVKNYTTPNALGEDFLKCFPTTTKGPPPPSPPLPVAPIGPILWPY